MGAANIVLVYRTWGAVLGDQAMRLMVYMALIARDGDAAPWFGLGHEALAELALGREAISKDKDPKAYEANMRAVRRPVAELHRAGAITTAKRATNTGGRVRYRLWLAGPSPDVSRPVNNSPEPVGISVDNSPSPDEICPVNGTVIGRNLVDDRTKFVQLTGRKTSYPYRGLTEEEGGAKNSEANLRTARRGKHARDPPQSLPA